MSKSTHDSSDRIDARIAIVCEFILRICTKDEQNQYEYWKRSELFAPVDIHDINQIRESLTKKWQIDLINMLCKVNVIEKVEHLGTISYHVLNPSSLYDVVVDQDNGGTYLKHILWPSHFPAPSILKTDSEDILIDYETRHDMIGNNTSIPPRNDSIKQATPTSDLIPELNHSLIPTSVFFNKTHSTDTASKDKAELEAERNRLEAKLIELDTELQTNKAESEELRIEESKAVYAAVSEYVEFRDKVTTNEVVRNALGEEPQPGGSRNKQVAQYLREIGFRHIIEERNGRRVKVFIRHESHSSIPPTPISNIPLPPPNVPFSNVLSIGGKLAENITELIALYIGTGIHTLGCLFTVMPGDIHDIIKLLGKDHNLSYIPYALLSDFIHSKLPEMGFIRDKNNIFHADSSLLCELIKITEEPIEEPEEPIEEPEEPTEPLKIPVEESLKELSVEDIIKSIDLSKKVAEVVGSSEYVLASWLYEKVIGIPIWKITNPCTRMISDKMRDIGFTHHRDIRTRVSIYYRDEKPSREVINQLITSLSLKTKIKVIEDAAIMLLDEQPHTRKELFYGNEDNEWQMWVISILRENNIIIPGNQCNQRNKTTYTVVHNTADILIDEIILKNLANKINPFKTTTLLQSSNSQEQSVAAVYSVQAKQNKDVQIEPNDDEYNYNPIFELLQIAKNHAETINNQERTINELFETIKDLQNRIVKLEGCKDNG
jgi:hypothetical protein